MPTNAESSAIESGWRCCGPTPLSSVTSLARDSGGNSVLVLGVGKERRLIREPNDKRHELPSSRDDRLELPGEDDRVADKKEIPVKDFPELPEFLLKADGIFCVSIAAGGFLLKRLPAIYSALCLSASRVCCLSGSFLSCPSLFFSFSLFLLVPLKSDQLGDKHISDSSLSLSLSSLFPLSSPFAPDTGGLSVSEAYGFVLIIRGGGSGDFRIGVEGG